MEKIGYYLGVLLTIFMVALALISTAFRIILYTLDDVHPLLSKWASETYGVQMAIGQASSEWRGVFPSILLEDVSIKFSDAPIVQQLGQVSISIDVIESFLTLAPVPGMIAMQGGEIHLQHRGDGKWGLEGMPIDAIETDRNLPADRMHFREMRVVLSDQKTGHHVDLGEVDMDGVSSLWGVELRARSRDGGPDKIGFELQLEFDTLFAGEGVFRVEHAQLAQLLPWLPDDTRPLLDVLPEDAYVRAEASLAWDQTPQLAGMRVELDQSHKNGGDWQKIAATLTGMETDDGYALMLERLELDQKPVLERAYIAYDSQSTKGHADALDVSGVLEISKIIDYPLQDFLPATIEGGKISNLSGQFYRQEPRVYQFQADLEELGVSLPEEDLRLSGVAGKITGSEQGIRFHLDSEDLAVTYPPLGYKDFRLGRVQFQLDWNPGAEDCCVFLLTDGAVSGRALNFRGWASLSGAQPPQLQAEFVLDRVELPLVSQWVPTGVLLEADERWVKTAFKAGRLEDARLRVNIPWSAEGFAAEGSELTLRGDLREVDLDYEPPLPMFEDIHGFLLLDKAALHVIVQEAKLGDGVLSHGAVRIDDLGLMDLYGSALAHGPAVGLPNYLEQTGWLAPEFNQFLKFSGPIALDFQLTMPLDNRLKKDTEVQGALTFSGNQLDILPNETRLEEIQGEMRYVDDQLSGTIGAKFLGRAARIDLATSTDGDTQIKMGVMASPKDFLPKEVASKFRWLDGRSDWRLELLLPGVMETSRRRHVSVVAASNLKGVDLDLPQPFSKEKPSKRPLRVEADLLLDGKMDLVVLYENQARVRLGITPEGAVKGAVLVGGQAIPASQGDMLTLGGKLSKVNLQEWLAWRERYAGADEIPAQVTDLEVEHLELYGMNLKEATLSARLDEEGSKVEIDSPAVKGSLKLPLEEGAPATGDLEWFYLETENVSAMTETGESNLRPQDIPPLDLKVAAFQLGQYRLDNVHVVMSSQAEQVLIEKFQAEGHEFKMGLTGHWELKEGRHQTKLQGTARTGDLHKTLSHWAIDNPLREGVMEVDLDLHWEGTPFDYQFRLLDGHADLRGRDGRILEGAPELARVLALLNLEMIFNRLSLDFGDVVEKGFTYKTAEGTFVFKDGSLTTNGFRFVGPSAQILLIGRIGVEEEDYDLKIVATPETSVLLPVAAGAVAGPVGIAGAYIGNKVMEFLGFGIDEVTKVHYRVTGSWDEPVMVEVPLGEAEGAPQE